MGIECSVAKFQTTENTAVFSVVWKYKKNCKFGKKLFLFFCNTRLANSLHDRWQLSTIYYGKGTGVTDTLKAVYMLCIDILCRITFMYLTCHLYLSSWEMH